MIQDGYLSCEEALQRLPAFLDREHDPADDALIRAHLDHCETCVRKYRFERSLLDGVRRALRATSLPPGLAARISSMLAARSGSSRFSMESEHD
ncbi:MAG: zf-HC2 domain-containing protein [Gemmatimonadales bacterium]